MIGETLEVRRTLSGFQNGTRDLESISFSSPNNVEESYFSELLGYSVDRITKEPDLLRTEQDQLKRRIQETSVTNYRSFITTSNCLHGLQKQLDEMAGSLEALDIDLPKLQAAAESFRRDGTASNTRREAIRQLYSNHTAVLDLLEIPALMDTCIRSGNFDEALDLRAYANKLTLVHGELPLISRLLNDVSIASSSMLEQLLERLQGNVQLPECLRVIGYLRRLSIFRENELRLQFLQRREIWIASLAADLEDTSAYEFLKRLTDIYRLHLFDAIMQYRAIFAERQHHGAGDPESSAEDGDILHSWAERRVRVYLSAIEENLPRISDGGGLASVLDHAMYCGASLGRVGLDFRPLLAPFFESAVLGMFKQGIDASTDAFVSLLSGHKWIAIPSAASRAAQLRKLQQQDQAVEDTPGGLVTAIPEDALAPPPASLVEHAPLAVYTNGLLAALNELRHCAPLPLRSSVAETMRQSLMAAASALAGQEMSRSLTEAELPVYRAACNALTSILCPYIVACFERVYQGGGALLDVSAVAGALALPRADANDGLE